MKLIYKIGVVILFLTSCHKSDNLYVKKVIHEELDYSLSNFTIISFNASGIRWGSDFDEQFVLGLDSNNFEGIFNRINQANFSHSSSDSLIQYDRGVNANEYVSIQLNKRKQTLTYTHWSD